MANILAAIGNALRYSFDPDYRAEQYRKKDRASQEALSGLYTQRRDDAIVAGDRDFGQKRQLQQEHIGLQGEENRRTEGFSIPLRAQYERENDAAKYQLGDQERRSRLALDALQASGQLHTTREMWGTVSPELAATMPERMTNAPYQANLMNASKSGGEGGGGREFLGPDGNLSPHGRSEMAELAARARLQERLSYYDVEKSLPEISENIYSLQPGGKAAQASPFGTQYNAAPDAVLRMIDRLQSFDPANGPLQVPRAGVQMLMSQGGPQTASTLLALHNQNIIDLGPMADELAMAGRRGGAPPITADTIRDLAARAAAAQGGQR